MTEMLRLEHVQIYERALRVVCGLQTYWREGTFMRARFTEDERALVELFYDVRFIMEYPRVGWWRTPHSDTKGTYKPDMTHQHGVARFVECLRGYFRYERDERIVDTGHPSKVLWSMQVGRMEAYEWGEFRRDQGRKMRRKGHLINNGNAFERRARACTPLAALETVWFPLDFAQAIGELKLHRFGEPVVAGKAVTDEQFVAERQAAQLADQFPEQPSAGSRPAARGGPSWDEM
jgi:hypothetical protein